jgi:methionyl-tRNA synthetase
MTVLYNLIESIRFIAVLLSPFMPETAEKIMAQINGGEIDYESIDAFSEGKEITVGEATPLFARLDEEKKIQEVADDIFKAKEEAEEEKTPEISIDDFAKVELKVGKVLECQPVEGAKKLLVSKIKIGKEIRQIVSGIASQYSPEDMIGKKVVVVTNLKPVKLRGVLSEGMILAASDGDVLSLLTPDKDIEDGSTVS